jgi:hypothetical protein
LSVAATGIPLKKIKNHEKTYLYWLLAAHNEVSCKIWVKITHQNRGTTLPGQISQFLNFGCPSAENMKEKPKDKPAAKTPKKPTKPGSGL